DPQALQADLSVGGKLAATTGDKKAVQAFRLALAGMEYDPMADLQTIAALAQRGGLPRQQALAAITRVPAEILGVDGRVGSLAAGKDADLLVLSSDPLAAESQVLRVYVNGRLAHEARP